ncbi:MAG TPA: hypothetical protein VI702_03970, partial [Nitrospiria bacterium]
VIAANQYINTAAGQVNIAAAGDEQLQENGAPVSSNSYPILLCGTGADPECLDFPDGLLYKSPAAPAAATYVIQARASAAASINAESKILAISIQGNTQQIDWQEIYP